MLKLRNGLLLLASIGLVTGLSWIVYRVFDPDRLCLQWDGLEQVSLGHDAVPACGSVNRLQRPKVSSPLRDWVSRLNRLNRLDWLGARQAPISVQIDLENAKIAQFDGRTLLLGYQLADRPGHLEHAVLNAWVSRNWPDHDELTRGVMADVFTWIVIGSDNWVDPATNEKISIADHLRFSLTPDSPANYCQFSFRSESDVGPCEKKNLDWMREKALRPLISWTIWRYVRELPASRQLQFLHSLVHRHFTSDLPPIATDRQRWVRERVIDLLDQWSLTDARERRELRQAFRNGELLEPVAFDMTVEVPDDSLRERTLQSLQQWSLKSPSRRILFVSGNQKIALPENAKVDVAASDIQSRRYVMLACHWPKIKDVMPSKSHLFYAFRICESQALPSWRQLLSASPSVASY